MDQDLHNVASNVISLSLLNYSTFHWHSCGLNNIQYTIKPWARLCKRSRQGAIVFPSCSLLSPILLASAPLISPWPPSHGITVIGPSWERIQYYRFICFIPERGWKTTAVWTTADFRAASSDQPQGCMIPLWGDLFLLYNAVSNYFFITQMGKKSWAIPPRLTTVGIQNQKGWR